MWANFGPYHLARLKSLAARSRCVAIQCSSFQRLYSWSLDPTFNSAPIYTLASGTLEDQSSLLLSWRVWGTLNAVQPNAVLVPGYGTLPAIAAAVWARVHRRISILMCESTFTDRPRSPLRERLKSLLVRTLYDCAIVGGKRSAAYVRKLGLWEHSVGGCYDVVDNEYFAREVSIARSTAPQDSRQHFLFVGRLADEKNVAGLIRAYRLYRDAGGQWGLVLVGQGPRREDLRALTAALGLTSDVKFEGQKDTATLVTYYAHATAFVLPSTSEPWGLVVNEAMASGLPVIVSSRCGCVDDLVKDGENGYITDPVDIEQLAGSMARMSALTNDERKAMGRRSLQIIASYSPSGFAAEVIRIIGQRG